jgi:hypothetical protein
MKLFLMSVLLFAGMVSGPAFAQPSPPFVPFTVTQNDLNQLDTMLMNNAPRVYEQVIRQWLSSMEQVAVANAAAEAAKKKAAAPVKSAVPPHK